MININMIEIKSHENILNLVFTSKTGKFVSIYFGYKYGHFQAAKYGGSFI